MPDIGVPKLSWLHLTQPTGKNMGIQIESNDADLVLRMRSLCRATLPRDLDWFHQGDDRSWQFFEFWQSNHDRMLEEAMRIADELGLELHLEEPPYDLRRLLHTRIS